MLIPYAIQSIKVKNARSNIDQNIIFSTNFIGMFFASIRAVNQESNLQKLAKKKKLEELQWKSRGNYLQLFAQLGYGYGYWGRYSHFEKYLKDSKVTCDFENFDLALEYSEVLKNCDSLDSTMAAFFANELNVIIKKNLNCLISHSHEENRAVNDLLSHIDIFTNILTENCGA